MNNFLNAMSLSRTNNFWDAMSLVGSVLLIIGVLVLTWFATRWYARRMGVTSGKHIKILDRTSLGGTSSLVLVEIAGKHYLLGASDRNVQLVCEIEDFERFLEDGPASTGQVPFAQMLRELMNKTGKSAAARDDGGEE